jgi:hypothetical protein
MNAIGINALKDAVKSLAQTLQVSTIFPAGFFVLINAYYIVPLFDPEFDCASRQVITVLISLTLLLSYTFYAFNFPLIRFVEGYKLRPFGFIPQYLRSLQKRKLQKRKNDRRFHEIDRDFPPEDRLLPTNIGNVIAAFEEYPNDRYGMDAIALWSRLVPVLEKQEFLDHVTQEKAIFDFLLNMCVVIAVLGVELTYRASFLGNVILALGTLLVVSITCTVLWEGMYIAARQWGTVVRVAFDLYRHDLAEHLVLRPVTTFGEEYEQWQAISRFYLYGDPTSNKHFIPRSKLLQFKDVVRYLESQSEI